jgi:hypothetical protein
LSGSVVLGARCSVIVLAVLLLAAAANAATWNEIAGTRHADRRFGDGCESAILDVVTTTPVGDRSAR